MGHKTDALNCLTALHKPDLGPDEETEWVAGVNILTGEEVYIPFEAVVLDRTRDARYWMSSDGLASGNNVEEAIFHGVLERIERDAHVQADIEQADLVEGLAAEGLTCAGPDRPDRSAVASMQTIEVLIEILPQITPAETPMLFEDKLCGRCKFSGKNQPGYAGDLRQVEPLHQVFQPPLVEDDVIVGKRDEFGSCRTNRRIARIIQPDPIFADIGCARFLYHATRCLACRGIIHHDDLDGAERLFGDRGQATA